MISQIDIFGIPIRGDFFLIALLIIVFFIIIIVSILSGRRSKRNRELKSILADKQIQKALSENNEGLTKIIEYLREEDSRNSEVRDNLISDNLRKIVNDITWDVAGLIGIGVTVVILIMVVSGTVTQIPSELFNGWLLILGYYFGKGSRQKS